MTDTAPTPADRPADQLRAVIDVLGDAQSYLSALHGHVARHDNLGADFTCGGCDLHARLAPALAVARQLLGTTVTAECGCDPAPHREDDGTYSHWAGCPVADEQQAADLTAEEARDLAADLNTELYQARDALAFVGECCDIADRAQRPVTTGDVREWLKGAPCGRQLLGTTEGEGGPSPAAAPLAEVWTVWREDEPVYAHYTTEDDARQGTIDCWQEDEPSCPDYSWRKDGPRLELVVGGEFGGVYASRHRVYGAPPAPVDRAALLRAAADTVEALPVPDTSPGRALGATWALDQIRRLAGDAAVGVLDAPTDRAAILTEAERTMLNYALNQAQLRIWAGHGSHTEEEQAALVSLRRLAGGAAAGVQPPTTSEAHPTTTQWAVELYDPRHSTWVGTTRFHTPEVAADAQAAYEENTPTWTDGSPVRRRIVRVTTTYTVQPEPAAPAAPEEPAPAPQCSAALLPATDEAVDRCVRHGAHDTHATAAGVRWPNDEDPEL
ncbi:hypothetical protein [Streptomyces sp. EN23]|uniref:hypothetical protein n=1 Tax=Streptomyces sp. EN23 TaxID=212774 RepID=UPI000851FFC0|nr:hypothetical protein [Streptomyces sp. EN23]